MNKTPNPWHVSFSYARALQNTVLKTWQGNPANVKAAQDALLRRAKARPRAGAPHARAPAHARAPRSLAQANSDAQLGKFVPTEEDKKAIEGARAHSSAAGAAACLLTARPAPFLAGMYQKGYVY